LAELVALSETILSPIAKQIESLQFQLNSIPDGFAGSSSSQRRQTDLNARKKGEIRFQITNLTKELQTQVKHEEETKEKTIFNEAPKSIIQSVTKTGFSFTPIILIIGIGAGAFLVTRRKRK